MHKNNCSVTKQQLNNKTKYKYVEPYLDEDIEENDESGTYKDDISIKNYNNANTIASYLKDVSNYKLLSFEEEKNLSKKIKAGDEDALNNLIQSNLRLVIKIARQFTITAYNLNDLIQDGNIGLMRAAKLYDHTKNVRFANYAAYWIRQSIIRSFQKSATIKIPHRKEQLVRKIQKTSDDLFQQYNRKPHIEEIATKCNLPVSKIKDLEKYNPKIISLEASISEDGNFNLQNTIESNQQTPIDLMLAKDLSAEIDKALCSLYPKERAIIKHRFGLKNAGEYTLKKISEKLGISQENVRQLAHKSLQKLRSNQHLTNYIY